jgi:hypothetical protein
MLFVDKIATKSKNWVQPGIHFCIYVFRFRICLKSLGRKHSPDNKRVFWSKNFPFLCFYEQSAKSVTYEDNNVTYYVTKKAISNRFLFGPTFTQKLVSDEFQLELEKVAWKVWVYKKLNFGFCHFKNFLIWTKTKLFFGMIELIWFWLNYFFIFWFSTTLTQYRDDECTAIISKFCFSFNLNEKFNTKCELNLKKSQQKCDE